MLRLPPFIFYVAQTLISGLAMFSFIMLASHSVEPSTLGEYFLNVAYASVISGVLNAGLVAGYERGFFEKEDNTDDQVSLLKSLFCWSSATLFVSALVLLFILWAWFRSFDPSLLSFVMIYLGSCLYLLQQYFTTQYRCSGLALKFCVFASMPHLFLLASLGTFLYTGVTLMVLEYSYILSHTLTVFIILVVDKALFNAKYPIRLSLVWHTLYISWPLIPRVILGLLNNQLDRLFIGGILGPAILAVYAIAQSISISVFQFMTALGRIFQPQIYRICFGKQPMENLEKWSLPFLNLTLAFAALISIISDYMISYTLPQAYDGAQLVVLILINTYVLCFAAKINGIQLSVAKKFGFTVASIGINIIVYVGLLYPLHEKFSLAGVGLAFFVSQLCGNSFLFFVAQKFCHLPLSLIQIVSRHVLFILIFLLVHSFRHEQEISIKLCVDLIVAVCLAVWIIRTKSLKAIL